MNSFIRICFFSVVGCVWLFGGCTHAEAFGSGDSAQSDSGEVVLQIGHCLSAARQRQHISLQLAAIATADPATGAAALQKSFEQALNTAVATFVDGTLSKPEFSSQSCYVNDGNAICAARIIGANPLKWYDARWISEESVLPADGLNLDKISFTPDPLIHFQVVARDNDINVSCETEFDYIDTWHETAQVVEVASSAGSARTWDYTMSFPPTCGSNARESVTLIFAGECKDGGMTMSCNSKIDRASIKLYWLLSDGRTNSSVPVDYDPLVDWYVWQVYESAWGADLVGLRIQMNGEEAPKFAGNPFETVDFAMSFGHRCEYNNAAMSPSN